MIDGRRAGPVFQGVGAISGGGGNSRLLIDYPARQRARILDYLFGPGGADLQVLKLEIGGDANTTDGAEPSVEHRRGRIDCRSGYEWWLAEQAVARNPRIRLYALQWAAPGWVGSVWSRADVGYVLAWLRCARSHHLRISYLGGWNEHGFSAAWYERMRRALDARGFGSVRLITDDSAPAGGRYRPATAWRVAAAAAADPAFRSAIAAIGVHDTCGTRGIGYSCESTAAARRLRLPLWESELGAMDANAGAAAMARAIGNGYIQAGITGYLEWPLVDAMAPGLCCEDRGLVTADQPWSGWYRVNLMTWAIAQTTQFTRPGWRYARGAAGYAGSSASYAAYLEPGHRDWSLVIQNTGRRPGQRPRPQAILVRLAGGLVTRVVRAWATRLSPGHPGQWFRRLADIRPARGAFTATIPPGYVVTFTSTRGQSRRRHAAPGPAPLRLPYQARPDASNEAWGLGSQEGAFTYARCRGGLPGRCLQQMAARAPVWWQPRRLLRKATPAPYAIAGSSTWADYTVSAQVLFTTARGAAGLIGRFTSQAPNAGLYDGYELDLAASGRWKLLRNSRAAGRHVLAAGTVPPIAPGTWHALALTLRGRLIAASVNGHVVATTADGSYPAGLAGIESNWTHVQFTQLTVRQRSGPL